MRDVSAKVVPAHLRRFVVEQDYDQYNAVDQAVWRFVLLQTYGRLLETAHPTYRNGLAATGISVDHIPRISEMNERLSRFGWAAVCVDGFIPPRAFQEFQAHGILPIAADIRSRQHLAYTPAPDIIHEAAGHAPILPDPVYARFLRRIGELGAQAFTVPEEDRVFQAIHDLSQVKEAPGCDAATVSRAEVEVHAAIASVHQTSEAARLSRLYWWTAEYGLVGGADDYKIYGAGLLSSLGESHSCHHPSVRKIPLTAACMDVAYDITQTQPQLFVASSFEELHEVLDQAERQLTRERGGGAALQRAVNSRDVASIRFSSGAWAIGTVRAAGPSMDRPAWLEFHGPVAFARGGKIHPAQKHLGAVMGQSLLLPTGRLAEGRDLGSLTDAELDARGGEGAGEGNHRSGRVGDHHRFNFASGALVEGRLDRRVRDEAGRLMHVELSNVVLSVPGRPPVALPHYALLAAGELESARAGAIDPSFYPETDFGHQRVPRPRLLELSEQRLLFLYRQAQTAGAGAAAGAVWKSSDLRAVHDVLAGAYPQEWLLRWNILESLYKTGAPSEVTRPLYQELEHLEEVFQNREPIASGLRYLSNQQIRNGGRG
ncbi:MAG: aromatic amino acid hydroxylase [Polyangia bacterium]